MISMVFICFYVHGLWFLVLNPPACFEFLGFLGVLSMNSFEPAKSQIDHCTIGLPGSPLGGPEESKA